MIPILVTGGSGQLGMSLKKIFNSKYEIICAKRKIYGFPIVEELQKMEDT